MGWNTVVLADREEYTRDPSATVHAYVGYSLGSAVAEGVVNGYGATDQQPPSQSRSQMGPTYGYGGIEQPPPSSQRNVPGSRGVMWPHLVPSSGNSQTLNSSAQGLPAYPANAPHSTPVAGSYNAYTAGAYNTGQQPASMVAQAFESASSGPYSAFNAASGAQQSSHQALPPRIASHRAPQPARTSSGAPMLPNMLPSISLTDGEGGAFARAPYPPAGPQSLGQPSTLRRTTSASSYRISGPQSLSGIHAGHPAHSEISRVATGPPGLNSLGHTSQFGMTERTASYGSGSFSLQKKSSMRWAAVSGTFEVESTSAATPSTAKQQQHSAATSNEHVVLTAPLPAGALSGAAGSSDARGSAVPSGKPPKGSSGVKSSTGQSAKSNDSGTQSYLGIIVLYRLGSIVLYCKRDAMVPRDPPACACDAAL